MGAAATLNEPSKGADATLHVGEYLSEAAGLTFFMINAAIVTTLLEYPNSPVHRAIDGDFLRRIPLGVVMGFVVVAIIYSPWGKRSGAHINPAVTWAFYRLRKISLRDAFLYTIAQFAGGIAAAQLMKALLGAPFAHPSVMYATTRPGSQGELAAFAGELVITFGIMLVTLFFISSKRLEKFTGVASGVLIMLYLFFETPLSGMSMNPARSFGSAVAGWEWRGIWVYFVAPMLAAQLAAQVFVWVRKDATFCAKLRHVAGHCIFCDAGKKPIPTFPVQTAD